MNEQVWYSPLPLIQHRCKCWQPKPVRLHKPGRKVYIDRDARPIFLKPSEQADFTPEELAEFRKRWAVP
jgi:hypothetical protein